MKRTSTILAIIASFNLAMAQIYVKQDASGNNDGSSWENAYNDLAVAIANKEQNSELWVAEGIYKPTQDENRKTSF